MNRYLEETILNADPIALTCIVYRHAIENLGEAREHLRQKRIPERCAAIMRAYAALVELLTTINREAAPEIAGSLQGLYSYMMQRLLQANMEQADEPLAEVLGLLVTLSEAWNRVGAEAARGREVGDQQQWAQPAVDGGFLAGLTA